MPLGSNGQRHGSEAKDSCSSRFLPFSCNEFAMNQATEPGRSTEICREASKLGSPLAASLPTTPALTILRCLIELRNNDLEDHEQRLGRYAFVLCKDLSLDPEFGHAMRQACSFHDLGKVVLPDAILLKPAALTADEWDIMCRHCALGYEILKHGTDSITRMAAKIALTHHEGFDGSGYPSGLKGYSIPLEGRIATVCDVYDALREHRVYRPGLSHEEAMHIMLHGDGNTRPTQFDPDVLRVFASNSYRYADLFEEYQEKLSARKAGLTTAGEG
jgi:HD-GYP domain-containing protein (c-di-GMP phosphodiesterase class II)